MLTYFITNPVLRANPLILFRVMIPWTITFHLAVLLKVPTTSQYCHIMTKLTIGSFEGQTIARSMIHFDLIFVKDVRWISEFIFTYAYPLFQNHLLKRLSFLQWITVCICQRSVIYTCTSLFLYCLFSSIGLYIYFTNLILSQLL
jgi:hypothetical protein